MGLLWSNFWSQRSGLKQNCCSHREALPKMIVIKLLYNFLVWFVFLESDNTVSITEVIGDYFC